MGKRTGNPTGRPRVEIDYDEFEKLCHFQCTLEEVAIGFECSPDTIETRVKEHYLDDEGNGRTFSDVSYYLRGKGKIGLRRKQFQRAMGGSDKMLIHLGKQHLGQSDKQQVSGPGGGPIQTDDLSGMTNEELIERIAILDRGGGE